MKFNVIVTYKQDILDPQGKTIQHSIEMLGYSEVKEVRSGKYFQIEIDCKSVDEGKGILEEVSRKLLANPNIETFKVETE